MEGWATGRPMRLTCHVGSLPYLTMHNHLSSASIILHAVQHVYHLTFPSRLPRAISCIGDGMQPHWGSQSRRVGYRHFVQLISEEILHS
jgi:hypothetical protein